MKQKILRFVLSAFLLGSCSPSKPSASSASYSKRPSSGTSVPDSADSDRPEESVNSRTTELSPLERILDKLAKGYAAKEIITSEEIWGMEEPIDSVYEFDFASTRDYYQYRQFDLVERDDGYEKDSLAYAGDFTHVLDDDGREYVNTFELNLDNEVHYTQLLDSVSDHPIPWDSSSFSNAFRFASPSDFSQEGNQYSINAVDADKDFLDALSVQLYGYDFSKLVKFTIVADGDNPLSFKGEYQTVVEKIAGQQVKTFVKFSGEFLDVGNENVIKGNKKLVGKEDSALKSAFDSLKAQNYEYQFNKYQGNFPDDGNLNPYNSAEATVKNESIKLKTYLKDGSLNFDGGYYSPAEGYTQELVYIKDKYYKNGEPNEYPIVGQVLPAFDNISTLFFRKVEENRYEIDPDLYFTGYDSCHDVFSILNSSYVRELKITLGEDSVSFENFIPATAHRVSEKVVETYSSIGKVTSIPVSYSSIQNSIANLKWSEIFANSKYLPGACQFLGGEEILDMIPNTEDNHSKYSLFFDAEMEDMEIQYHGNSLDEVKAMAYDYGFILKKAGFTDPVLDSSLRAEVYQKPLDDGRILKVSVSAITSFGSPYFFILPSVE